MSEAWREVARLGKTGDRYPHILADSHGWCLRLGPRDRTDDKYYSSFQALLGGLIEHSLRRRAWAGEKIRTLTQLRDLVLEHLELAAVLGADLEEQLCGRACQRAQEGTEKGSSASPSPESSPGPGNGALASESSAQAA
jgi:hypothetical protein